MSPEAELGYHAVPGTGDETGLLQAWLWLKVFADCVFCWLAFRFLDAAHLAGLDALFPPGAHGGALDPGAARRHRDTLVPGPELPVVLVFVPVAHSEAALLVVGPLCLVAVGVQGGPAFGVGTPYRPALAAAGATLTAHATAPRTWKKTKEKSRTSQRVLQHGL